MDVWRVLLFGFAGLLAVRSLTALVTVYRYQLMATMRQREQQSQLAQSASDEPRERSEA